MKSTCDRLKIVGGHASQNLAAKVAKLLRCDLLDLEFKRFPDGEVYTRVLGEVAGEIAIIQSTPNDGEFIHLLQLIDACEGAKITAIVPYFGYARQDRRFQQGEAISARAMARALEVDRIFTINIHNKKVLQFFKCPAQDLDASPLLGEYLSKIIENPVLIAPDEGAVKLAEAVAGKFDLEYDCLAKTRLSAEKVEIKSKKLSVEGRDIVLIDDIISTGGTILEAAKLLKLQGARGIYVACVHAVLAGAALSKLYSSGVKEVISTDTLEKSTGVVSVAPLIANALSYKI